MQAKKKSRRYPTKTITDAGYADDRVLPANTPARVESLQHNLERAVGGTEKKNRIYVL